LDFERDYVERNEYREMVEWKPRGRKRKLLHAEEKERENKTKFYIFYNRYVYL